MLSDYKYTNQVKPEQIIKIFAKDGQVITIDQANKILEFMYMLADMALDIAVKEMRKEKMDGSISNGFKSRTD
jgi:hypothetical protein